MRKKFWIPQKIGAWPQFLWWELDEILVGLIGLALTAFTHQWIWLIVGVVISYLYKVYYKPSAVKALWKDLFVALGLIDLPGFPKGFARNLTE